MARRSPDPLAALEQMRRLAGQAGQPVLEARAAALLGLLEQIRADELADLLAEVDDYLAEPTGWRPASRR